MFLFAFRLKESLYLSITKITKTNQRLEFGTVLK